MTTGVCIIKPSAKGVSTIFGSSAPFAAVPRSIVDSVVEELKSHGVDACIADDSFTQRDKSGEIELAIVLFPSEQTSIVEEFLRRGG